MRYELVIHRRQENHEFLAEVPELPGGIANGPATRKFSPTPNVCYLGLTPAHWSHEDHASLAEVPELPGCMADGASYEEALANAKIVNAEWIGTAQALGRPIPESKGKLAYA